MQNVRQLTKEFRPQTYALTLDLQRQKRHFRGTVHITGELLSEGTLTLHARKLAIIDAQIDGQAATHALGKDDELVLSLPTPLARGQHEITITFEGAITDPMSGLYPCYFTLDGQKEELLATHFESHAAREVFPCVDEPAAKATFDVQLTTETDVTVIGNTKIESQQQTKDRLHTTFATTPVMSTYLLAFVVGKMKYLEATTKSGVIVRTYATPDHVAKTQFALETSVRTLELFDEVFGVPYPLAKCDLIGLPDFAAGAMENWGCITFRESAFFVDDSASTSTRQRVAEVVAHELAHQWFGNLVTMQWWNDLWLNESFATWVAAYARHKLFPEWHTWTQFFNEEISYALDRDALPSIQSVRQDVHHPDEIMTLFDGAIVYGKGASLLHMLHAYIGEDALLSGLRDYIATHAYKNATAEDLWRAWQKSSGKDVGAFMDPWIHQPGHPIVHITQRGTQVTLTQTRFFNTPDVPASTALWPIPLFSQALPDALLQQNTLQVTATSDEPVLLNAGRAGFYLPLYDADHLALLAGRIAAGKIAPLDRLGLLNDAYDLAKSGKQSTLQLAKLVEAYRQEDSQPVWVAISGAISALRTVTNNDEDLEPHIRALAGELAHQQFVRLGWQRITGESYFDELLRPAIVSLMAYSENDEVIAHALQLFADAAHPCEILGDIRGTVLSLNAKYGDDATFERLVELVTHETHPEIRTQLTAGLCSGSRTPARIEKLISLIRSDYVKLQDVFYWVAYLSRNHHARAAIWQWTQQEWQWITDNFSADGHITSFPAAFGSSFATSEELAQFNTFFDPMLSDPLLRREILQAKENINSRLAWQARDFAQVQDYLRNRTTTS